MPAIALHQHPRASRLRFSLVGQFAPLRPSFVQHAAMLNSDHDLFSGRTVVVYEQHPPLALGQLTELGEPVYGQLTPKLVAWLEDLSEEERDGMLTWIEDTKTRVAAGAARRKREYIIHPPAYTPTDASTGRRFCWRFSCAGLVMKCYASGAGIQLLSEDWNSFPLVPRELLEEIWELPRTFLDSEGSFLGVPGPGPWRIVLAGYLFQSLRRDATRVRAEPYTPQLLEEAKFE